MTTQITIVCPKCHKVLAERPIASMAQGRRMEQQMLARHICEVKENEN